MRYKVQELAGLIVIALIVSAGITQLVVGLAVADIADGRTVNKGTGYFLNLPD